MIAIIDYGVGNLRSVEKAFHFIGAEAVVTSDKDFILNADAVVLPGVGAFADAMDSLRKYEMVSVVKEAIKSGKPFLGICLGMQLLFDYSEEGGERVQGLEIFKGSITQLPRDAGLKVPHIGWNSIKADKKFKLFEGIPEKPYVYFVHSYYLAAEDRNIVAATTDYGMEFDVAVGSGNVFATQFHPEKSGDVGLQILKNWVGGIL
jgi:imidazole glycerol-phosphate synthase subunit HisH